MSYSNQRRIEYPFPDYPPTYNKTRPPRQLLGLEASCPARLAPLLVDCLLLQMLFDDARAGRTEELREGEGREGEVLVQVPIAVLHQLWARQLLPAKEVSERPVWTEHNTHTVVVNDLSDDSDFFKEGQI